MILRITWASNLSWCAASPLNSITVSQAWENMHTHEKALPLCKSNMLKIPVVGSCILLNINTRCSYVGSFVLLQGSCHNPRRMLRWGFVMCLLQYLLSFIRHLHLMPTPLMKQYRRTSWMRTPIGADIFVLYRKMPWLQKIMHTVMYTITCHSF